VSIFANQLQLNICTDKTLKCQIYVFM
jgi:hypothetical protein